MKRLFFDIEVSPNIGFFWQPGYKVVIDYKSIIKERAVICACYKWENERKVYALTWDKYKNDKQLLAKLTKVMLEADEIVAHNGDKFDQAWIRTRCLFHGIPMPPTYVSIDTLKAARSRFKFNSNRLDYLGQFLQLGQKMETGGFDLWKKITLNNDKKSLKQMVEYCKNDVVLLESVFKKLNPYIPSKTRCSDDKESCPECGSHNSVSNGVRRTISGGLYRRLNCKDCGKWFQSKISTNEKNS